MILQIPEHLRSKIVLSPDLEKVRGLFALDDAPELPRQKAPITRHNGRLTEEQSRKLSTKYLEAVSSKIKNRGQLLTEYAINELELYPKDSEITAKLRSAVLMKARYAFQKYPEGIVGNDPEISEVRTTDERKAPGPGITEMRAPELQMMLYNFLSCLPESFSITTDFLRECFDTILPLVETVEPDYSQLVEMEDVPKEKWFEDVCRALGDRSISTDDRRSVDEVHALAEISLSGVWTYLDEYYACRIGTAAQTCISLGDGTAATLMVCKLADGQNATPMVVSKEDMPHYIQMFQNDYNPGNSSEPSFQKASRQLHETQKDFVNSLSLKKMFSPGLEGDVLTRILTTAEDNYRVSLQATNQRLGCEWESRDELVKRGKNELRIPLIKKESWATKRLELILEQIRSGNDPEKEAAEKMLTNRVWYDAAHEGEDDDSFNLTGPDMLMPMRYVKQRQALMDVRVTLKWFVMLARAMEVSPDNKFLLFLDDLPVYKEAWEVAARWDTMRGLKVVFLPAKAASYLQPLVGVLRAIKDEVKLLESSQEHLGGALMPLQRLNNYCTACDKQDEDLVRLQFGESPVMLFHEETERSESLLLTLRYRGLREIALRYKADPGAFTFDISNSEDKDATRELDESERVLVEENKGCFITSVAPTLETSEEALLWLQCLSLDDLFKGGTERLRYLCAQRRASHLARKRPSSGVTSITKKQMCWGSTPIEISSDEEDTIVMKEEFAEGATYVPVVFTAKVEQALSTYQETFPAEQTPEAI